VEDSDLGKLDLMIEQMMNELTSKELLAEPFKELALTVRTLIILRKI
jgi:hypothetical protein